MSDPAQAMDRLEAAVAAVEAALQRFLERRLAAAEEDAEAALAELRASYEAELRALREENARLRAALERAGVALEESAARLERLAEE